MKHYDPGIFSAVRAGSIAPLLHFDLDLSSARSFAAGTQADFVVSGDALYIDANPNDGTATVILQPNGSVTGEVPLYVSPGVIFNVPFTRLSFENAAQPGKKIRVVYGVGTSFQPGSIAQLTLAGDVALDSATINQLIRQEAPTNSWALAATYAGGATVIFTAAQNPNGAILLDASMSSYSSGAAVQSIMTAKATAPATFSDGEILLSFNTGAGSMQLPVQLAYPKYIAPNLGLWLYANADTGFAPIRSARWKIL